MKRVVVKRRKAGPGAKRKAPSRRASAKTAPASKTRKATGKRRKTVQAKATSPGKRAIKRKPDTRKSRLKVPSVTLKVRQSVKIDSPVPELLPPLELDMPAPGQTLKKSPLEIPNLKSPGSTATKRESVTRLEHLKIPPILLEGDEPESHAVSGPGEKFSLGPETPAAHFATAPTHLPATYGTERLFLTARDPHWIYAHWDINPRIQFQHNARSVDRHLILRMHEGDLSTKSTAEIHVHPESRHWFAHVERAGTQYVADLGYYQPGRKWKSLATSAPMRTPPDSVSTDSTVEFATIPLELPFETMLSLLKEDEGRKMPLAHAIQQLRERRLREFPPSPPPATWTPEQERALAAILAASHGKPALRGSQEGPGLPGDQPHAEGWPATFAPFDSASSLGEYASSPLGGGETSDRNFWFKINAELIIYGSTEPNAKVSIAGKEIPLQPDGSFSFRFALPDGQYEMPVVAVSADGTDARATELRFSRGTKVFGDVGAQPQDPALKPPTPDNV